SSSSLFPSTSFFYTLSLHDALPICFFSSIHFSLDRFVVLRGIFCHTQLSSANPHGAIRGFASSGCGEFFRTGAKRSAQPVCFLRSEEHTSELQSLRQFVWRLLLEKK